jgi:hypothetical protein
VEEHYQDFQRVWDEWKEVEECFREMRETCPREMMNIIK